MNVLLPESVCQSEVLYFSFRLSLLALIDELMGETLQVRSESCQSGCLLDRFPLLSSTAAHVQLECLLTTWDRIQQRREFTLLDEAVSFAALEFLSEASALEEQPLLKMAWAGPRETSLKLDHWVCSHARSLQVALLPARRTWQLEMMPSLDSDRFHGVLALTAAEQATRNGLLTLVGRWRINPDTENSGIGLMTESERGLLRAFFEEHPGLLA